MVDFQSDISRCVAILQQGGVIVYPTDTVWGIGCDATNAAAIEKVFALKNRPAAKSMIVLLAAVQDLPDYVTGLTAGILTAVERFDRPTTVVYDHAKGLAANAPAADGSIGIRVVKDDFCRQLITAFGKPIISTSANPSGMPTAVFFHEIDHTLLSGADYIVHFRQDDLTVHQPSRIIRFDAAGIPVILRA